MKTPEKLGILIYKGFKETDRKIREIIRARREFIFKKGEEVRPQPKMPPCRLTRGSAEKVVFFAYSYKTFVNRRSEWFK